VQVPTGAWLLIGVGSALVIITVLLVFVLPSARRPPSVTPRRLRVPRLKMSPTSPVRSLLKGFSYLYEPLTYSQVRYSVGGRLEYAIARIDSVDPSLADERVGHALQQMVEVVSPEESAAPTEGGGPARDIFDQPRHEEQL
jgi:hypothetical protein